MPGKHFDLDTNKNLGGNNASDIIIASQKAVKGYVDDEVSKAKLTQGDNISISNGVISGTISNLDDLKNVKITQVADGQGIAYDATNKQWINVDLAQEKQWGDITGSLENQTDLKDALDAKANNADLKTVAKTGSYTDLTNKPTIPTVSNTYSATSTNAMSGQAVASAISGKANTADLKAVATSGDYKDLTNKPTIPTITDTYSATSQNGMSGKAVASAISGKANTSDLADVATSGDYNDLENLPTIPTVTDTYSASSSSAMSGKAVASAISGKADASTLKTVATSGSYNDLTDKPNIPVVTDTYNAGSSNGMSGKAVASAISNKADKGTTLAAYGIENAYTKIEIDGMLTSVYIFQGSVDTYDQLPATSTKGFVYNVAADGMNYAWDGEKWDALGATLDLSGYVLKVDADKYYAQASHTHAISEVTGLQTALDAKVSTNSLASVATSGNYNDLNNKPTIPTISDNYNASSSNGMSGKAVASAISGKVDATSLADVAISGSYNDLADKPTIPTVNNATLTIKRNNVVVDTFTANASANKEINIAVPTITDTYSSTSTNGMSGKAVASAISGKADTNSLATVATSGDYEDLSNKPSIPTVTDTYSATGTDAISGKGVASAISGKANWADISAVAKSNSYDDLDDKPTIPVVSDTYSAASSNAMSGKAVASAVSGKANDADLATVAKTGSFTDLINKPTIDTTLSSTSTNAVENKAIKAALDGKQPSINDLDTIRSNATAGKGAADTIATYGDIVSHNANEFQAAGDYALASDIPTKVSELDNDENYVKNTDIAAANKLGLVAGGNWLTVNQTTGKLECGELTKAQYDSADGKIFVGKTTLNNVLATKQDTISDLATIKSNASAGKTAKDTIDGYGDIVTHNASEFLTQHNPIDAALSDTSTNAVQNKAVKAALDLKANASSLSNYVPTTRTVNNKALSSNITLTASDVGATTMAAVEAKGYLTEHQSLANYYNKTEIDGKLTGAMHYKGTVANVASLPTDAATGDMYNVTDTGANYAWDGSKWDKLSENIDLSGVVPTSRKVNGKALSADITLSASDVGAATMAQVEAKNYLVASDIAGKANSADLADVATSGSYNDLSDKPTIPSQVTEATVSGWGFTKNTGTYSKPSTGIPKTDLASAVQTSLGKADTALQEHQDISGKSDVGHTHTATEVSGLAKVATSGAYSDLSGKPTIPTITDTYSATSGNGMSGKAVASAISGKANSADLKTVATTGSYNDLTDKPTIPSAVTETTVSGWGFTKNTGTLTGVKMNGSSKTVTNGVVDLGTVITDISGKSNIGHKHAASDITSGLATVATSGSYNDLTNKPTIPTQTTITFRQW